MSGRGLLDADMHTIGRWLLQGWHWWVNELQGLAPVNWRRHRSDNLPRLLFQAGELRYERSVVGAMGAAPRAGLRAIVTVPQALCLTRLIERPPLSARDLQHMLVLERDMLLPFAAGSIVVAARLLGPALVSGRTMVEVAGLPADIAQDVATAITATGVIAVHVLIHEERTTPVPIDFAPAMREAGLIAKPRSVTPMLWVLVAFLVALNLGVLIWRDAASAQRLEQIVQEQQPAVSVAQIIARRIQRDGALVARSAALRQAHDPQRSLVAVSRALPPGVWLQRYVWDGATVRLTGYKPPRTDVATALRRTGDFAEVRSLTDESQATVPAGDPFDLSARIVGR